MHLSSTCVLLLVFLCVFASTIQATNDIRHRFEGLVGRTVQFAWQKIDQEAPGRPIEFMRVNSPQAIKPITPGYVRVILHSQTGRVLYTPILQPN